MVDSTKVVYFDQNIWSRIANRGLPEMSFEETLNWFRRVQKRGDFIFILSYVHCLETAAILEKSDSPLKNRLVSLLSTLSFEMPTLYCIINDEINRLSNGDQPLPYYLHKFSLLPTFDNNEWVISDCKLDIGYQIKIDKSEILKMWLASFSTSSVVKCYDAIMSREMEKEKDLFQQYKSYNGKQNDKFLSEFFRAFCGILNIPCKECDQNDKETCDFAISLPCFSTYLSLKCDLYSNASCKINKNDWRDIQYLSAAIPYTDIVVGDRKWINTAKNLKLGERFQTDLFPGYNGLEDFVKRFVLSDH